MPAETHQRGPTIGPAEIRAVMSALLGDDVLESPDDLTLASLGVDDFSVSGLWLAVREEFGEPTMGRSMPRSSCRRQ